MHTRRSISMREFDERFNHFNFKSRRIPPHVWKGSGIVPQVFSKEMEKKYKSSEERLIYRLELWVDVCRIENMVNGVATQGHGKFYTNKKLTKSGTLQLRSLTPRLQLKKTITPPKILSKSNIDRLASRSSEELNSPGRRRVPLAYDSDSDDDGVDGRELPRSKTMSLSPSFSTNHLDCSKSLTLSAYSTYNSSSSTLNDTDEETNVSLKNETSSKRKFNFFVFRKKTKTPAVKREIKKSSKSSSTVRVKKHSVKSMDESLLNKSMDESLVRHTVNKNTIRENMDEDAIREALSHCITSSKLDIPSPKARPSIYNIVSSTGIPEFSSRYEIERRYLQNDKLTGTRSRANSSHGNKFNTIQSVVHNVGGRYVRTLEKAFEEKECGDSCFYDPKISESDVGYV